MEAQLQGATDLALKHVELENSQNRERKKLQDDLLEQKKALQEESKGRTDADKATKNQVDMELQIIKQQLIDLEALSKKQKTEFEASGGS